MRKRLIRNLAIIVLVIVAIIGVLAFVLIQKNNKDKEKLSAEKFMVNSINKQLEIAESIDGKNPTMFLALQDANDAGYNVANFNAESKKRELVWDQSLDRFALIKKQTGEVIAGEVKDANQKYNIWKISKDVDEVYSTYYIGTSKVINTSKGFDVGEIEDIVEINYSSNTAQKVIIRTNGGKLTVNDTNPNSEQVHYGLSRRVEVSTGTSCFYTYGEIDAMHHKSGKVVAMEGSYVGLVKAAEGTEVVEQGGLFAIPINATTDEIHESVVMQLSGFTVSEGSIIGDETRIANSFYNIGNLQQLKEFRDGWNNGSVTITRVELTDNVDLSSDTEEWTPFGTWEYPYYGTFDGNDYIIKGLKRKEINTKYLLLLMKMDYCLQKKN